MTLTAAFSGAGFPEERRALLLSGDDAGLRDLADRLAARQDGALPVVRKRETDAGLSVRLSFCDSEEDERLSAGGAHVILRLSPASAERARDRTLSLIGQRTRAFRYLDLRRPAQAAFSVVVVNY
ncbi:MAG: hypothetical protein KDK53_19005 [Maritimibacter sp.]|nr:hypothetical protein [Maritimibacter sp.]